MDIRALRATDAAQYRELRLRGLMNEPHAFLADYEEECALPVEETRTRLLELENAAVDVLLGAFEGDALVGVIGLSREPFMKARHRAHIWGTYVVPERRGAGLGGQLVNEALRRAGAAGIEQVHLAVVATAVAARALYRRLGFALVGVVPRAIRARDVDLDEHLMVYFLSPHDADDASERSEPASAGTAAAQ